VVEGTGEGDGRGERRAGRRDGAEQRRGRGAGVFIESTVGWQRAGGWAGGNVVEEGCSLGRWADALRAKKKK
jgi:hypothetical protein